MRAPLREWIPLRLRLLLALLVALGLAGCGDAALQSPAERGPVAGLPEGECGDDCKDDDDDDDDNSGAGDDGDDDDEEDEGDDDCDDDGGDDDDPHLLCEADDAPSLVQSKVTFYAVRGQARSASLWYHADPGSPDSTELVRLEVGPNALLSRPDGTPIAEGDSVPITLEVVDQARGIVWFQPVGLRFSAGEPAVLIFGYGETNDDINGDGVVNQDDEALEATLALWRQQTPADPFVPVPSQVEQSTERVRAEIDGFTRYAVAY